MTFKISALPRTHFEHLFPMRDEELVYYQALREIVTKKPGSPCRVSLADAELGEEVLLVHYQHQNANSPFRASHAVYVRPRAPQANPLPDEVPVSLHSRILSLRGFNTQGMMVHADLADGRGLGSAIERFFALPAVDYLHLHYAKPGCYAARVDRH